MGKFKRKNKRSRGDLINTNKWSRVLNAKEIIGFHKDFLKKIEKGRNA